MIRISRSTSDLVGKISLTASKSESNRVLIIRALCAEDFQIDNLAKAKDTQTMMELLASQDETKDVGPAGTTMRFLTAYLSTRPGQHLITGSERMKQRPIGILVNALRDLGADITYEEQDGYPPLRINGDSLEGKTIQVDGSVSSQFLTALLLVGPSLKGGLTLDLQGKIASVPYLKMTIELMKYFGAQVDWQGQVIAVKEGGYTSQSFTVEADWSAASYWYQIAAFSQEVDFTIEGLKKESLQGDSALAEIYEHFGIHTEFDGMAVRLTRTAPVDPTRVFEYDFSDCPDIAQTVAATCAGLGVQGRLTGLESLRIKETDRIAAMKIELEKLGARIEVEGDDLIVSNGITATQSQAFETYDDHRMAMCLAPLAQFISPISMKDPDVVVKSYPDYWTDLKAFGFEVN